MAMGCASAVEIHKYKEYKKKHGVHDRLHRQCQLKQMCHVPIGVCVQVQLLSYPSEEAR